MRATSSAYKMFGSRQTDPSYMGYMNEILASKRSIFNCCKPSRYGIRICEQELYPSKRFLVHLDGHRSL